jgi:predicted RNA-binding Zn ribbon-like protein
VTPEALIVLANLGRPRRPSGAPAPHSEPVLPDPAAARDQLAELVPGPIGEADLRALRHVQQFALAAAEAVLDGRPVGCAEITALARGSTAHLELTTAAGGLRRDLVWSDRSIPAGLARRLIEELAALEPGRLRRCARSGCDLVFYDTTRSRTRRWHAEDPCGWRERQRHRRTHSGPLPGQPADQLLAGEGAE